MTTVADKIKAALRELKEDIKDLAHRRGHKHQLPVRHGTDQSFVSLQPTD